MTTLMVQTDRVLHNFNLLRKAAGKVLTIPVLSANAYGLGDAAMAALLMDRGAGLVAVSKLEEAERLVRAVPGIDVLLLTPYTSEAEAERIVQNNIIATVSSNENAVLLSGISGKFGRKTRAHLRFDTGAGSTGFLCESAKQTAQTVRYLDNLTVTGVYTKLRAGAREKAARQQYEAFTGVLQTLSREGIDYGIAHMASTEAALRYPWARLDAVRVGKGLCGRLDGPDKWGFKKVGRLVTNICDIRWMPAGHTTGENGKIKIRHATKLATVPVGYADGLFVGQKNGVAVFGRGRTWCEVGGKRAPILGRPGFTTTIIDVTDIECRPGDIVSFDVSPYYVNPSVRRDYV